MSHIKFFLFSLFVINISFAFDVTKAKGYQEVEAFIGNIKTMQGRGTQEFEGKKLNFTFFLSLPGKFTLDYTSKDLPIKIILNNSTFTYYDKKVEQKTQLPASSTIASLLMVPKLSLTSESLLIIDLKETLGGFLLEFEKRNVKEEGLFKLYLKKSENGIIIEKLEVIGDVGKSITKFEDIKINHPIKGNPFFIPNKKIY